MTEITNVSTINKNLSPGVGAESPCSHNKNGKGSTAVILNYTANLDVRDLTFYRKPVICTPKFITMECHCNRYVVASSCMSLICPYCKKFVNKRRSASIFRRLVDQSMKRSDRHKIRSVIYTVFTVPEDQRHKYIDPKAWQKIRKKVWQILKSNFGGLYGVEVSHPVGDKDENKFHPHFNFLWIQRDGYRPFLDVDKLRFHWGKVLNVPVADVYSRYSNNVRKIKHWCSYVSRVFVGLHKWAGSVRWYGKYPRGIAKVERRCADCGGRFKMIGLIAKLLVDEYYKHGFMIGRDPPWMNDDNLTWKK